MLPKYIIKKIEQQHNLLDRAQKLTDEILEWYDKQIIDSEDNYEDYYDIQFDSVGYLSAKAIEYNIQLK